MSTLYDLPTILILRQKRRITLRQLAEASPLSLSLVQKLSSGYRGKRVQHDTIVKLNAGLRVIAAQRAQPRKPSNGRAKQTQRKASS